MLFEQNFISSQTPLYYRIFHIRRMHNPMTANPITDVLIKDMSMFMPNPPSFLDWAVSAPNDHLAASADCLIFWCFCPLCQLHCCWIHYLIAWTTSFLYWIDWSQVCMTPTLAFRLFSYCFCNASKNVIICFVQHCFLFYGVAISLGVGSERSISKMPDIFIFLLNYTGISYPFLCFHTRYYICFALSFVNGWQFCYRKSYI